MKQDLYEQQLQDERNALSVASQRYQDYVTKRGHESTSVGARYMSSMVAPLAESISVWRDELAAGQANRHTETYHFLQGVDPEELALLTVRSALSSCCAGESVSFSAASIHLGGLVEEHVRWAEAWSDRSKRRYMAKVAKGLAQSTSERHRRAVVRAMYRRIDDRAGKAWSASARAKVGAHLYHRLADSTGHFEVASYTVRNRTVTRLRMAGEVKAALQSAHDRAATLHPQSIPMRVPPLDWSTPHDGGYLTRRMPLLKRASMVQMSGLSEAQPRRVYAAVNALQRVQWGINTGILDIASACYERGDQLAGLPDQEPVPLPAKPADIDDNRDALTDWKRRASEVYESNARIASARLSTAYMLACAEGYRDADGIYYVYQLDTRGRAYPLCSHLSPQGSDLARALLRFHKGKPLGEHGAYWLAVHLANMYGQDKVSMDDRVQWVLDHHADIMDSALSPVDGGRWWAQGDKPWCVLAACLEWAGYAMVGTEYVSHLPIHVDGSCNGLQHYAAMLRDEDAAAAVNLTPGDSPADVYQYVADHVSAELRSISAAGGTDESQHASHLLATWPDGVPRALVKQPVMTIPYGVTLFGMRGQIEATLHETPELALQGEDCAPMAAMLARLVWSSIGDALASARAAMDWLQECTQVANDLGKHLQWTTPIGLPVMQQYRETRAQRVTVFVGGRRYRVQMRTETAKVNKGKSKSALAPNYVHSMDASHLLDTVLRCRNVGITDFFAVHDSYATQAGDMDELSHQLRQSFVAHYSGSALDDLHRSFEEYLGTTLPSPPPQGSFDVAEVLHSEYFFA